MTRDRNCSAWSKTYFPPCLLAAGIFLTACAPGRVKIARGEGTLGALLVDPTVYENLTPLLEGARRSWIIRWVIRSTLESGREAQQEEAQVANKK